MHLNITLVGRLCSDPEVKTSKSGTSFCKLNIACQSGFSGGEKETTFVNVLVFDKKADFAGKYLKKGALVFVDGSPKVSAYVSKKTGEPQASLEVLASSLRALTFGAKENAASGNDSGDVPF